MKLERRTKTRIEKGLIALMDYRLSYLNELVDAPVIGAAARMGIVDNQEAYRNARQILFSISPNVDVSQYDERYERLSKKAKGVLSQ